jgi:hypothetical protein
VQRLVARYGGCLARLPVRQRRVLRLRAGVGPGGPETRAAVARKLELPLVRVRRAERRGLRALRRAAREGCAVAATDGAGADPALAAVEPVEATTAVLASGSTGRAGPAAEGDGGSAGGGRGGTERDAGGVKGISATGSAPAPGETGVVLPIVGVLLLLVCLTGFGIETRRVRRSRTDAGPHG